MIKVKLQIEIWRILPDELVNNPENLEINVITKTNDWWNNSSLKKNDYGCFKRYHRKDRNESQRLFRKI